MEEEVVQSATERLFQYGVLGIVVVIFAAVIVILWRWANSQQEKLLTKIDALQADRLKDRADQQAALTDVEKQRREDLKASQDEFVELVKQSQVVMLQVTNLLDSLKGAMAETKSAMKEIATDLRNTRRDK